MSRHILCHEKKKGTLAVKLIGCLVAVVVAAGVVPRSASVDTADTRITATIPLRISNVRVSSLSPYRCKISWITNAESDSQVLYDTTQHELWEAYSDATLIDPKMGTVHSLFLTGLTAGTTYHFRVRSAHEELTAISDDLVFTTKNRGISDSWWRNWWKW